MGKMVRKQVYLEQRQETLLKQRARTLGVTEAELIRRGVDRIGQSPATRLLDAKAWQDEIAFIRRRARKRAGGGRRRWTRESLYDERLRNVSR